MKKPLLEMVIATAVLSGCDSAPPAMQPPADSPSAPAATPTPEQAAAPAPPPTSQPAPPPAAQEEPSAVPAAPVQVAIYALSRGKGVPEETRAMREQAREALERLRAERRVLDIEETRIGIEGERRLCATFASRRDAEQAVARLRSMSQGVELFNIVVEPCAKPGPNLLPQGEKQ